MTALVAGVRLFALGGFLSYRALFVWLRPSLFVPTMLVTPIFQVLFFAHLGRFAGVADDQFFVVGNAVQVCAIAGIYGPMLALSEERAAGVLPPLLASPGNRVAIFLGRMFPFTLNGLMVSAVTLAAGGLLLDAPLHASQLPAIGVVIAVSAAGCSGLGLVLGAFALVGRDVPFLSNLVHMSLLLLSGANVAVPELPLALRTVSAILPFTRGIDAARRIADGSSLGSVAGLVLGEVAIGACYLTLAVLLLARVERLARRRGTLYLR